MKRGLWLLLLAGWAGFFLVGCSKGEPSKAGGPDEKSTSTAAGEAKALRIAVIPKGTTHVYWKSVHAGASAAAKELSSDKNLPAVVIDWQGPIVENDRENQINLVETFIQKHVDGIVLAPLDDKALIAPVQAAQKAGIPVVIIDSDIADPDSYISFVATDNTKGGMMGAQRLAECLGEAGGKVILLRYEEGSASTANREKGFLDEMAKHPKIQIISSNQYAGPTVESALKASETLLTKFGGGQVDGIFCPNESSTYGMLQALTTANRTGKIKFVGFDSSEQLIEALKKNSLNGLVVQNPYRMGYDGVKTVVAHIRGTKCEKRIDTGVVIVTPDNLTQPDIVKLLSPPRE